MGFTSNDRNVRQVVGFTASDGIYFKWQDYLDSPFAGSSVSTMPALSGIES